MLASARYGDQRNIYDLFVPFELNKNRLNYLPAPGFTEDQLAYKYARVIPALSRIKSCHGIYKSLLSSYFFRDGLTGV